VFALVRKIIAITLVTEGIGAIIFSWRFALRYGLRDGITKGVSRPCLPIATLVLIAWRYHCPACWQSVARMADSRA
jgi:hypothetical protein